MMSAPVGMDRGLPSLFSSVPTDALITRGAVRLSLVTHVLRLVAKSQIEPSVIEAVTVSVVNILVGFGPENEAMQSDFPHAYTIAATLPLAMHRIDQAPASVAQGLPRPNRYHSLVVGVVYEGNVALS